MFSSWGISIFGLGLTLFFSVVQMIGVTWPRWLLSALASVGVMLMLVWPSSLALVWLYNQLGMDRPWISFLIVAVGCVVGGLIFGVSWWVIGREPASPPQSAVLVDSNREAKAAELETLTQGLFKRVNEWWTFCEQPQAAAQYRKQAEDIRDTIINRLRSWGLETEAGYFNRPKPVEPHRRNLERCPEGVLINEMWYRVTRAEEIIEKIKSGKISLGKRNDVTGLTKLRDEGVTLRNRHVASDQQWVAFHRDFQDWDKSVGKEMRNVGVRPSDINWFETLDQVPALQFSHVHNNLHAKDLRELSEKLRRLLEITQHHDR